MPPIGSGDAASPAPRRRGRGRGPARGSLIVGRTIELELPPRNDYLALARRAVAAAARLHGAVADRRVEDLSLAVSEACTNAVNACRARGIDAPVHLRVELTSDSVLVTVTDHAGGFEPDDVDPIPAAEDPRRLIRSLADEASFTATADGTSVAIRVLATDDRL